MNAIINNNMNTCIINSNSSNDRTYLVKSASSFKAAQTLGRGEDGEVVSIYNKKNVLVSRSVWNSEEKKYMKVTI